MEMSERIKSRRKELSITQEELAQKLGLQKSAIAKYENGRVENIKRSVIQKMAIALNCTPCYLMGWEDVPESTPSPNLAEDESRLLNGYRSLNDSGKAKMHERLSELIDLPRYSEEKSQQSNAG